MNETIQLPNGVIVNSYNIIGTDHRIYEAFEPSSYKGNHIVLHTYNGQVYGAIGSRRTNCNQEKRSENVNEAVQYILDAFPHLESIEYGIDNSMGRIETFNE